MSEEHYVSPNVKRNIYKGDLMIKGPDGMLVHVFADYDYNENWPFYVVAGIECQYEKGFWKDILYFDKDKDKPCDDRSVIVKCIPNVK